MKAAPQRTPEKAPDGDAGDRHVFFDVFGTVVDWHGGVVREGERLGQEKGLEVRFGEDEGRSGRGSVILV